MKKFCTLLLALILCAGIVWPFSRAEEQDLFFGSYSTDKTYSRDLKFYALQTEQQAESYQEIVVTVYETASDTPVFSFTPGRASDHWGICWERDSYNIWVQSGDTGTSCWEYLDGEWKCISGRVCPEYIVSRRDDAYRDHPETWASMYRTLTDPPAVFPATEMVRAAVRDDFLCVAVTGENELPLSGSYARAIFIEFFGAVLETEEDQAADANGFPTADTTGFEFLAGSPENGGVFPAGYYQIDSKGTIAFSSRRGEDPVIVCKTANDRLYDRLVYVLFAAVMGELIEASSDALSKDQIFSLVQEHHDFLLQCITDNDPDRAKEVTGIKSIRSEKDEYVEFYCGGSGLVPSSSYYGFYYSPDGLPLAVDVTQTEDLTPAGGGFGWEEPEGDNWYYTEQIMENWYYYESHY